MDKNKILAFRKEMKKSPFKIWLRAFLLVQFSFIFGVYLFHDIGNGYFKWEWVALLILFFIPVGFLMSHIVPMQANIEERAVTLSLDKIYLVLIWILVIGKLLASYVFHVETISDVIMCTIIGIMGGRLGGIGIRVRKLKRSNNFI
ncbi:MAG: hypothetical protein HN855_12085 [Anaerolineae bacterium]|jgi:hypothetical protein|nr:hypothetical protein [Anaerolineae bacterium]MBT7071269.1 hypothetical protein [Anaerolineae bacterium]MBT7325893.1 hypothetical protein [Anaerolineae bacterium]